MRANVLDTKRLSRIVPSAAASNCLFTPADGISISDVFIVGLPNTILLFALSLMRMRRKWILFVTKENALSRFCAPGRSPQSLYWRNLLRSIFRQRSSLLHFDYPSFISISNRGGKTSGKNVAAAFLREKISISVLSAISAHYILFRQICDCSYKRIT